MLNISIFKVGKHDAFEIPLTYVQHCQAQKNEVKLRCDCSWQCLVSLKKQRTHFRSSLKVTLEFAMNDDAPVNLSEMRFHIPGILSFFQSINIFIISATEQAGEEGADPAEAFRDHVVKKANIATTSTGDAIAIFREITSLSPRGR